MFELTFLYNDRAHISLAREYWLLDPNGEWIFSIAALKEKYGIAASMITKTVQKTCIAHASKIRCRVCQAPMVMESRKKYEACLSESFQKINLLNREAMLCSVCEAEYQRKLHQIHERKEQQINEAIDYYVSIEFPLPQPKDYAAVSKMETFLLYGLFATAGEALRGNQLKSWEDYLPKLFAHQDDTVQIYELLQKCGWIAPSADSKRTAFTLENLKVIKFNKTRVNWVIAPNVAGVSLLGVLPLLYEGLKNIINEEKCEIWYMVCLSELRVYFEELHERFEFRSAGWTPLVEENMRMLLHECSLAEAKGIVWSGIKSLVTARADKNIKSYLIKNWIPGVFMRTLERHRGYGPLTQWSRPNRTDEAFYTSLLFDKVLGKISNPYATLRGADLV